jgi:hypothetical protein
MWEIKVRMIIPAAQQVSLESYHLPSAIFSHLLAEFKGTAFMAKPLLEINTSAWW